MIGHLHGRIDGKTVDIGFSCYHVSIAVDGANVLRRRLGESLNHDSWLDADHEQVIGLVKLLGQFTNLDGRKA